MSQCATCDVSRDDDDDGDAAKMGGIEKRHHNGR